jgi:hypothetical protein
MILKLRKRAELVNWLLEFSQRKDLKDLSEKEVNDLKGELGKHLYKEEYQLKNAFNESSKVPTELILASDKVDWANVDLQELADDTLKFFKENLLTPNNLPGQNFTVYIGKSEIDSVAVSIEREGKITWYNYSMLNLEIFQTIESRIMEWIHGCTLNSFHQCKNPECTKWFFNPSAKEQLYCSRSCLWQHKSRETRERGGEEYKREQRIRMQFTYTAAKELPIKSTMRAYMKKQGLEESKIDKWLEWWEQKTKKNKEK